MPTAFEYCNIKIQKSRTNPENRNLGKLCIAHVTDHSPRQPVFISWFKAVLPHLPPVMGSATKGLSALVSSCMYTHHQSLETSRSPDCENKLPLPVIKLVWYFSEFSGLMSVLAEIRPRMTWNSSVIIWDLETGWLTMSVTDLFHGQELLLK